MALSAFRGKITGTAILLLVCVFAFYMYRDLAPRAARDRTSSGQDTAAPDAVIDRLDASRTIDGRMWRVQAVSAERDEGVIIASLIKVDVRDAANGNEFLINAASGKFTEDGGMLNMLGIIGSASVDKRLVNISSQAASYDSKSGAWIFDGGTRISDGEVSLRGKRAVISEDGTFVLRGGAEAIWSERR
ncbi:hypothetical protein FACS1894216_09530 [Synergistales bacterium]|nr:hypothetical protein FACS1894216_09530 [Synergistales bacterium]